MYGKTLGGWGHERLIKNTSGEKASGSSKLKAVEATSASNTQTGEKHGACRKLGRSGS